MMPDAVAVRIADDGVAGAPERVVGRLLDGHAVRSECGHQGIDLVPGAHLEPEDGPGAPGPLVPLGGEGRAVEIDIERRTVSP